MNRSHLIRLGTATAIAVLVIVGGVLAADHDFAQGGSSSQAKADRQSSQAASHQSPPEPSRTGQRAGPTPRMPSLIGMTASEASDVVEDLGREVNLGAGPCQDRRPRGHVVWQLPGPGQQLFNNGRRIIVWLDRAYICSRGAAPNPCATQDLKFETFARHDRGDGEPVGEMLIGVSVENRGNSPCQFTATAMLELQPTRNPDALVRGSPRRLDFDYRLAPDQPIVGAAWWSDWCGSRSGNWRVDADVGRYHGEAHLQEPDCERSHGGSVLL